MKYCSALITLMFLSAGSAIAQTETSIENEVNLIPLSSRGCSRYQVISVPTGSENLNVNFGKTGEEILDITDPELSSNLSASPNPTKGMISVIVPANMIGLTIRVLDMAGRMVGEPILIQSTTQQLTIKGESGMYLILIESEKERLTARVVLEAN